MGRRRLANVATRRQPDTDSAKNAEVDVATSQAARAQRPTRPPRQRSTAQIAKGLLTKLVVVGGLAAGILTFVLGITIHYGNNMFPAIRDGDLVISYRLSKPSINAAVLYHHNGKVCVGRVVAMEGHEVDISDEGELKVNGIAPAEEVFYPTLRAEGGEVSYPYIVKAGEVFVLNDFRENTDDSRSFGAVDESDVMGQLLLVIRRRGF